MLALLLSVAVHTLLTTGKIWVRTDPGLVVYLDDVRACSTTPEESGCVINDVKVGPHKVRIERPGGGSTTLPVTVTAAETVNVPVSALALRMVAAPKGGVEVQIPNGAEDCSVRVADQQRPLVDSTALFDGLAPGRYHVAGSCGKRDFQSEANVVGGRVTILEVNQKTGAVRPAGDRPRVTEITVKEHNDRLVGAPIAPEIRRALIAAVGSIHVLNVRVLSQSLVAIEFEAPTEQEAEALVYRLRSSGVVKAIRIGRASIDRNADTGEGGLTRFELLLNLYTQ